jgi:hypothetical protein
MLDVLNLRIGWLKAYYNALRPIDETFHEILQENDTSADLQSQGVH